MMNNIYEMLIRRSRQATPSDLWNSYFPKQAFTSGTVTTNTNFVIERGRLIACNLDSTSSGGYGSVVGTSDKWTMVTETYSGGDAYGICGGVAYLLDYSNKTATSLNMSATLVAGGSYTNASQGNVYGLLCNKTGLYRLEGTTATLINAKGDWTAIGGGVGETGKSNGINPYALDSTGTVYTIAYDGTLTQIATGATAISAGILTLTTPAWVSGYYGDADEIAYYQPTPSDSRPAHYIYDGALYQLTQQRNTAHSPAVTAGTTGTLVDDTGTWTSIWVRSNLTYGVRDNSLCKIVNGYTDLGLAVPAWKAGLNAFIGLDDGRIYWSGNSFGRLTDLD